ncbi:nickel pincer cofactor biosynthesis protein LarB [Burkholderia sp. PAMC 26561]|uniref:nickel pincer cofactor biosynthesis protein LarB n=1 Tax=Burkholderia sp. PAMC 26561 TaxID=1795043 RepID=UPI00084DD654|nr:nickel pincer cofactor biosynthesis protein LarB [Burkholderia sp. PAMC 26561]
MIQDEVKLDFRRAERTGLEEAVYGAGKSPAQIAFIVEAAVERGARLLITRLSQSQFDAIPETVRGCLDYCAVSSTARAGSALPLSKASRIALLAAGTSDIPVAREAERTLHHYGEDATLFVDVGVAGLWRLMTRIEAISEFPVVIAIAGMDAALPTVVGGLIKSALIAVPTSVGYGVATGGRTALDAILATCSPGISVVNIDNGFGAACAAIRIVNAIDAAVQAVSTSHESSLISQENRS